MATEAILTWIQSQGDSKENSVACENLQVGENFNLEDHFTTSTARPQEQEDPDAEITNVNENKN